MKKLLSSVFAVTILFGGLFAVNATHASNDCKEVEFDHETVCVSIEKVRTDRFELITEREDGTAGTLRCDIMLPDSSLKTIPLCNGEFTFDDSKSGRIKLWIRSNEEAPEDREDKPGSSSTRTYPQWMYDFDDEEWMDGNYNYDDDDDDSDYDTDNFYISASPSDPEEDEDVDITVRARDGSSTDDSYRGTVNFSVERKSGSSWVDASSSQYDLARTSYTFTSSDDGEHAFNNLVTFTNDAYDYRLVVTDDDDDDIDGYKIFYLNGNDDDDDDSNYDADNFYVTTDDSTPSTTQRVDLRVKARDGTSTDTEYDGDIIISVYYRTSGSSSWIKTTSSSYFEIDSDYDDDYDDGISFSSSWNGYHTFTDFIKLKRSYDYKIVVEDADDNDIDGYVLFNTDSDDDDDDDYIDGFTSSELSTVQSMYDSWPTMISDLKAQYSKLRNSTTWNNRSDTFYDDMADILDDNNNRTYDDYDEYYAGFLSRYRYTLSIR